MAACQTCGKREVGYGKDQEAEDLDCVQDCQPLERQLARLRTFLYNRRVTVKQVNPAQGQL